MAKDVEQFKQAMTDLWDRVAPAYGQVGPKYWEEFGNRLVELANIIEGSKILDIGTGRGASLFPAAEKAGPEGKVIGIDISKEMVNETCKEILEKNIKNAEVINMDAETMDFRDESFDYAIGSFVFSYIFLSKGKFYEILRVLKRGGKAGFSVWGIQDDQKWLNSLFARYLSSKESNKSTDNNSSTSKPEKFDTVQDIKRILIESGFINVKVHQENNDVVYKNKEEWWQEMRSNAALRMFEQIVKLGMDKLENFKMDVYEQLANFEKEDGYHFNMPVIYVFGEK